MTRIKKRDWIKLLAISIVMTSPELANVIGLTHIRFMFELDFTLEFIKVYVTLPCWHFSSGGT